jgi:hypothetical protein
MSSCEARWAELSSQNERIVQASESGHSSMDHASTAARTQWAELASQRERLAADTDPLFRPASSSHQVMGMRLAASAA